MSDILKVYPNAAVENDCMVISTDKMNIICIFEHKNLAFTFFVATANINERNLMKEVEAFGGLFDSFWFTSNKPQYFGAARRRCCMVVNSRTVEDIKTSLVAKASTQKARRPTVASITKNAITAIDILGCTTAQAIAMLSGFGADTPIECRNSIPIWEHWYSSDETTSSTSARKRILTLLIYVPLNAPTIEYYNFETNNNSRPSVYELTTCLGAITEKEFSSVGSTKRSSRPPRSTIFSKETNTEKNGLKVLATVKNSAIYIFGSQSEVRRQLEQTEKDVHEALALKYPAEKDLAPHLKLLAINDAKAQKENTADQIASKPPKEQKEKTVFTKDNAMAAWLKELKEL